MTILAFLQQLLPIGHPPDRLGGILDGIGNWFHAILFLPPQGTEWSKRVDALQYTEFAVFWGVGLILFAFTAFFLIRYRRRRDVDGPVPTEKVTAPLWLELGVGGSLLAFFIGVWVVGFNQYTAQVSEQPDAYEIFVTAKQWVWKFDYPGGASTAGTLVLPAGRNVRLMITSRDVIHSFFVPDFRLKRDAVPGRYQTMSFEPILVGQHEILCAEFCGDGHSRMWGRVLVLEPYDFDRWLATGQLPATVGPVGEPWVETPVNAAEPSNAPLAERGRRVAADLGCLGCHTVDGTIHLAPTWKNLWHRREVMSNGDTITVTPGYITESMMEPQKKIVKGFDPIMPSFHGAVQPSEVAAIIEYIRSLESPNG